MARKSDVCNTIQDLIALNQSRKHERGWDSKPYRFQLVSGTPHYEIIDSDGKTYGQRGYWEVSHDKPYYAARVYNTTTKEVVETEVNENPAGRMLFSCRWYPYRLRRVGDELTETFIQLSQELGDTLEAALPLKNKYQRSYVPRTLEGYLKLLGAFSPEQKTAVDQARKAEARKREIEEHNGEIYSALYLLGEANEKIERIGAVLSREARQAILDAIQATRAELEQKKIE